MSAADAPTEQAIDPTRCPTCGGDHTLSTWIDINYRQPDQLLMRRRCVECAQGYVVVYACLSSTPYAVVR
jgi:hypothetical protein